MSTSGPRERGSSGIARRRSARDRRDDGRPAADPPPTTAVERDDQLGRRIRALRTERGHTLTGLAARVGITRSFLSSVERGVAYPSILVLRSIASALEVPGLPAVHGAGVQRHRRAKGGAQGDPAAGCGDVI